MDFANVGSTVVEHSPHQTSFEGLSVASADSTGREKMANICTIYFLENFFESQRCLLCLKYKWFYILINFANIGNTMVEHSPYQTLFESLSPATAGCNGCEKMTNISANTIIEKLLKG